MFPGFVQGKRRELSGFTTSFASEFFQVACCPEYFCVFHFQLLFKSNRIISSEKSVCVPWCGFEVTRSSFSGPIRRQINSVKHWGVLTTEPITNWTDVNEMVQLLAAFSGHHTTNFAGWSYSPYYSSLEFFPSYLSDTRDGMNVQLYLIIHLELVP